jgi:hypothetical protein
MTVDSPPIARIGANSQHRKRLVYAAKKNNKKKYKNTRGKKRREQKFRRDKPFYLNRFFEKQNAFKNDTTYSSSSSSNELVPYTTTAQIYQAMMYYYFVKGENEFRYSEIAEWLIKGEGNPIKDEYRGSHATISAIKANLRKTLASEDDSYLADFVRETFLIAGKKPGIKNTREETRVYRFTPQGKLMAYLIKYSRAFRDKKPTQEKQEAVKAVLIEYIEFLKMIESYASDWLAEFFSFALEKGYGEDIVYNSWQLLEQYGLTHDIIVPDVVEMFRTVQMSLIRDPRTKAKFADVWVESLKRFPEDIQSIIMMHDKTVAESNILVKLPPKQYQELWFKNSANYKSFTLCAFCPKCNVWYPQKVGYFEYRGILQKPNMKVRCGRCKEYTMELSDNVEFRGTDAKLRNGTQWHWLGLFAPLDYSQLNWFRRGLYHNLWFQQLQLFDVIRFFNWNPKFCHFL